MSEGLNLPRGPIREGVDVPQQETGKVFNQLILAAREIFEGTAFVTGKNVTKEDVEKVKDFYRKAAIIDPWIFNQSTQETLFLVARYSRMIGQKLNDTGKFDLNLDELEALGFLHDIGRTFSHRRYRNDQIGNWLMKKSGFTKEFLELIPPEEHWMPVMKNGEIDSEATRKKYSDISKDQNLPARAVVTIADILGKIEKGQVIRWGQIAKTTLERLHQPEKSLSGPKEFQRMEGVMTNIDSVIKFYKDLGTWLEDEMGANLEDVVDGMSEDIKTKPLEKTFNQENEQYQFNTVVFDLGGVILHGGSASNNNALTSAIAQAYGLEDPTQEIVAAMDECVKKNQIGISSSQTQGDLISTLGQPKDMLSLKQIYVNDAQELTLDSDMLRLIRFFQNEGIRVIFASNIVQDEWEIVEEKFKDAGLNIQLVNGSITNQASFGEIDTQVKLPVFTSFEMKVRKGKESQRSDDKTFYGVIKDIANLDPNKTLVVDDKAPNCAEAEDLGFKPYQFSTVAKFAGDIINLESNKG